MTRPIGQERFAAARTVPEATYEFDAPTTLRDVVERFLGPASAARRDARLAAHALVFRDGRVRVAGDWLAMRPAASSQLRALARVDSHWPRTAADVRRGLAHRTDMLVVRIEEPSAAA